MGRERIRRLRKRAFVPVYKTLARISRRIARFAHCKLFLTEWSIDPPEQFDHYLDLFWQWGEFHIPHWVERGVYNLLAIKCFDKPYLIELCCGSGFNTQFFYSTSCEKIWACDFDPIAIGDAKKEHQSDNIIFEVADIRSGIPDTIDGEYPTNIIWDAAIEHFTSQEIDLLMKRIKKILSYKTGILSGMTIQERAEGKSHPDHEYEFKDMEDLKRFFAPYFTNVVVWETIYQDRHNLYFVASDGTVPFTDKWEHWTLCK